MKKLFFIGLLLSLMACQPARGPNEPVVCDSLHYAAKVGDIEQLKKCLAEGKDVNEPDQYGDTPLHISVEREKIEAVKFLVNQKANINIQNAKETTALHLGIKEENLVIVDFLVAQGANVNQKDGNGNPPLHLAVRERNVAIVQKLLSTGHVDLNIKDKQERTALELAKERKNSSMVRILEEYTYGF